VRGAIGTAALGLLLILAAGVFDAEPLYVPGVAFAALAAGAAGWVLAGARGLHVTREVPVRRALEEEPVAVDVRVRLGPAGLPVGVLEDDLLPAPAAVPGASARGGTLRIRARFARRGRKVLPPPRVVVRDPFGLASRTVTGDDEAELLILPRLEPVTVPPEHGTGTGSAARRGRPSLAAEVDLDGLRPHREGAPASRIFWPALARGGELMERRLRAEGDTRPLVVLDPRAPAEEGDLDVAVRAAASLCVHLARAGGCALLLPGDRRPTAIDPALAGWMPLHVRLALIGPVAGPGLAGLSSHRGAVLYVAARRGARAPRVLAHAHGAERLLVVPGTLPGRRAVLAVAGCTAYDVGERRERTRRRAMRRPEAAA
jgi:uncharacterized protein (DUF58 family)